MNSFVKRYGIFKPLLQKASDQSLITSFKVNKQLLSFERTIKTTSNNLKYFLPTTTKLSCESFKTISTSGNRFNNNIINENSITYYKKTLFSTSTNGLNQVTPNTTDNNNNNGDNEGEEKGQNQPFVNNNKTPSFKAINKLMKTNISLMVTASAAAGYIMACPDSEFSYQVLGFLIGGTFLTSVAANIYNQDIEVKYDRLMQRTKNRPLVTGEITQDQAFKYEFSTMALGGALLLGAGNTMVVGLGIGNVLLYILYTHLKRKTVLNTWVGAIVGAVPPVMGTYSAVGHLDDNGIYLATYLFLWQIPHFLAISDLIREQYAYAGYKMLSVVYRHMTKPVSILHSAVGATLPWLAYYMQFGNVDLIPTLAISASFVAMIIPFFISNIKVKSIIYAITLLTLPISLILLCYYKQPFTYIPI